MRYGWVSKGWLPVPSTPKSPLPDSDVHSGCLAMCTKRLNAQDGIYVAKGGFALRRPITCQGCLVLAPMSDARRP